MSSTTHNIDKYFKTRRSIRKYLNTNIPYAQIKAMIEAAAHAPTCGNMQLYSVVVTHDPKVRAALAPAHFNQPAIQAPVILTFCADFNRFVKWCELRNAAPGYDNLESLVTAGIDTMCVAQQFCTIAEQAGLGTCMLGTTTYNAHLIAEVLKLPKRVVPIITVTLGYPAEEGEDAGRLPVEAVMHTDTYHDYTADDIDRLYAEKETRSDSRKYIAENQKETLAQVFTDVRYTRDANEHFSAVLTQFLAGQYPFEG